MASSSAHIIQQLQRDILPLQGYKPVADNDWFDAGLGFIRYAFPNATFPVGAMHEFICNSEESASASMGFISAIVSSLVKNKGVLLWINASQHIYPPALLSFNIQPQHVIFITVKKQKDMLWTMEEALKCDGLSAVVGEIKELDFTVSRRFQLAVEQSRVTGFLLRRNPKNLATSCITRWHITPVPGAAVLPGVGFARWNVELLKVRNGKPGTWQLEWAAGKFRQTRQPLAVVVNQQRKVS